METLTSSIELDAFTRQVLRQNRVEMPIFDVAQGRLNIQAAADTTHKAFSEMLAKSIPDPRQRLQVKIAVERALAKRGAKLA